MASKRALARVTTVAVLLLTVTAGCTINLRQPPGDRPEEAPSPASAETTPAETTAPPRPSPTSSGSGATEPASDWTSVTKRVRSGVLRLHVAGCEKSWSGTGFLLSDRYVVTAAHVARDAASISVKSDRGIVRAEVINSELSADTALLRLTQDLEGHEFDVASEVPGLGTDLGVLGYPFGDFSLRLTGGTVSGEETSVTYDGPEGFTVDHVVTTDAATNGGNSGGPAIDRSGKVIGLVSGGLDWTGDPTKPVPAQGTNYLVPSEVILDRVKDWEGDEPESQPCGEDGPAPVDEDSDLDVQIDADDLAADDIALSLYAHGDSINQGRYDAAWAVFTPKLQNRFRNDVEGWSQGLASSYWDRLQVEDVSRNGNRAEASVALRTRQDPADSFNRRQDCSDWSITYTMQLDRGVWFIDAADSGDRPDAC